jgi:branched-subunit amino acid ABC-type transport system permease component
MEYFLQIATNTVILASLYSLLALGFNFLYSTNKFFDLSYAAYLIIGVYSYLSLSGLRLGVIITFILSLCVSALFAICIEKFLYSSLRIKKSSGAVMMIASLGVLTVIQALIAIIFTSNIQTLSAFSETFTLFHIVVTHVQLAIIICAVVAYAMCYFLLKHSSFGVQLRAISDNEELAITSQLNVKSTRLVATALGATLGVIAAILYGMDTSIEPYMGMQLLLKGTIVAIAGGLGSMLYGVVGAVLLATVENLAIWYIGGEWKDAAAFLILIIILLWRPTGILKK